MRLNSLSLTNFRQHADSVLEFDTGLTGIVGPNGAGKSTVLEAIAWALYGQPAARGTKDSIRFVRAAPRASVRVELDFELGGHRYRVARGLNSAELYLDGGSEPIANSLSSVSDLLQRRLGMTRAEFFHTYFTGQKELNVMSAMGPSERAQFLSRVLGYEKLRVAQEAVREQRKLLTAELSGVRSAMPDVDAVQRALNESATRRIEAERALSTSESAHAEATSRLAEISPGWAEAQQARDRYNELSGELRVAESELQARTRDADRLAGELDATGAARIELTELSKELVPLSEYASEYARLEELARAEGRRQALSDSARGLAEELIGKRERRARIAGAPQAEEEVTIALEARRREVEATLGAIELLRTGWVRDRQEAETKRDALRAQLRELKKQREEVVQLGEDGRCPTCTRVLGENLRSVLEQIDDQIDTVTVDGKYFANKLTQVEPLPAEIGRLEEQRREQQREAGEQEMRLARVRSEVQELAQLQRELAVKEQRYTQMTQDLASLPSGYDSARHAEVKAEIERLAPLNERVTRLSTQLEREEQLQSEMATVQAQLQRLRARIAELESQRGAVRFSEGDYVALRQAQEAATRAAQDAEIARAGATAELKAAQRAAEGANAALRDLQKAQETERVLVRDKRLHDELDRAYTDLRTDLNHALRPELSELASVYLTELTDYRYTEMELDDEYNIVVMEDGRPKPVISGGEEDVANLALRLAVSQMIAERSGQKFSLLVLDEILGSLDEVRRHRVVGLLQRLQDRFDQVILITHIEALGQLMDREIVMHYDAATGASVVRGRTPAFPDPGLFDGAELEGAGL